VVADRKRERGRASGRGRSPMGNEGPARPGIPRHYWRAWSASWPQDTSRAVARVPAEAILAFRVGGRPARRGSACASNSHPVCLAPRGYRSGRISTLKREDQGHSGQGPLAAGDCGGLHEAAQERQPRASHCFGPGNSPVTHRLMSVRKASGNRRAFHLRCNTASLYSQLRCQRHVRGMLSKPCQGARRAKS
jgi:hypothetical protein